MDKDRITSALDSLEDQVNNYAILVSSQVDTIKPYIKLLAVPLRLGVNLRVSKDETYLSRLASDVQAGAAYHLSRGLYHASPALLLFLISAILIIKKIWEVVMIVVTFISIIKAFHIDDILYKWWPWYADQVEKIRDFAVKVSESLGWGLDGLMHLINVTQSGISVYGGLTGKGEEWHKLQGLMKMEDTLKILQNYTGIGYKDAGALLGFIFENQSIKSMGWFKEWSGDNLDRIQNVASIAENALSDAYDIGRNLRAISENMPETIARYIPQKIWTALDDYNNLIQNDILPSVSAFSDKLDEIDNLIDKYNERFAKLTDKLAHPGQNMLSVDDLPAYARLVEEDAIDDVASRAFQRAADADRLAIGPDLDEFDLIDQALSAPTPAPPFMSLEDPTRAAITGIIVEAGETWFIKGDY